MRRVQLFEFEDFTWFPSTFRSTMTKTIVVLEKLVGTAEVIANVLRYAHEKHPFKRIVDMGSGSGGAMPMVIDQLNKDLKGETVELMLTDLHPDKRFVDSFNSQELENVVYSSESLDACNLTQVPEGIKTMVNSFHHMPVPVARQILKSAQDNNEPILIYEMGENMVPLVLWWLLLPITLPMVALTCILFLPFLNPLNWKDVLFTWIIPVVPVFYAWDGQASGPRTYTFADIEALKPEAVPGYSWEVGQAKKKNGKSKMGYYILGLPTNY